MAQSRTSHCECGGYWTHHLLKSLGVCSGMYGDSLGNDSCVCRTIADHEGNVSNGSCRHSFVPSLEVDNSDMELAEQLSTKLIINMASQE